MFRLPRTYPEFRFEANVGCLCNGGFATLTSINLDSFALYVSSTVVVVALAVHVYSPMMTQAKKVLPHD